MLWGILLLHLPTHEWTFEFKIDFNENYFFGNIVSKKWCLNWRVIRIEFWSWFTQTKSFRWPVCTINAWLLTRLPHPLWRGLSIYFWHRQWLQVDERNCSSVKLKKKINPVKVIMRNESIQIQSGWICVEFLSKLFWRIPTIDMAHVSLPNSPLILSDICGILRRI